MFVGASVIVAILTEEPDAEDLEKRLEAAVPPVFGSPSTPLVVDRAALAVDAFLAAVRAQTVPIERDTGAGALAAARTYGKEPGHPASLNFGDCFAYACAKALAVPLLCKGGDFARTDLA